MDQFEGPEKKLEIVLSVPQTGLRDNADGRWDRVVRASGAEILKHKSTNKLDGYLLSESSLFVSDDRILLITCGRTTPVNALPVIFQCVKTDDVAYLIYKRNSLNFPDDQPFDFGDDLRLLKKYFAGIEIKLGPNTRDHIHVFYYAKSNTKSLPDASLQILMRGLDPSVGKTFYFDNTEFELQKQVLSRLYNLYPAMQIDNHFFYPQGYSLNGINDKSYFTIHVTPQPEASYASFESNIYNEMSICVIDEVVSIFNPKRYSLVLTTNSNGQKTDLPHDKLVAIQSNYLAMDLMSHEFKQNYTTFFSNFVKARH